MKIVDRGNFQHNGMGSALLEAAEVDARALGAKGIAAWGLLIPVFMCASWFKNHGYRSVDRQGIEVLLWKPFTPDAVQPALIRPKGKPLLEQNKVTVTAFRNGWCPAQNLVFERANCKHSSTTRPSTTMYRFIWFFILAGPGILLAQTSLDTTHATSPSHFYSIGFNASSASGLGLSYRNKLTDHNLLQLTGGVLTSDGRTNFSFGVEYQYQLSKNPSFRYYLTAGAGLYSNSRTTGTAGFGIGLELPVVGTTIFEGVTSGCCLFYPAFNLTGNPLIGIGGSVYLFYNF